MAFARGCPASGIVWALLYEPEVRCLWAAAPSDDPCSPSSRTMWRSLSAMCSAISVLCGALWMLLVLLQVCASRPASVSLSTIQEDPTVLSKTSLPRAVGFRRVGWEGALDLSSGRTLLRDEAGGERLQGTVARRTGRLFGEELFPPQAEVVVTRLRDVFRSAPFAVAVTSLNIICNGMPASKRFGGGAHACRFGCRAVGRDDTRHDFFCPVLVGDFARHHGRRPPM